MTSRTRVLLACAAALLVPACGRGGGGGGGAFTPAAPTGVISYSDCDGITLRWDPVPGASSYVVYMATQAGVTPANYSTLPGGARLSPALNPHRVEPLAPATTYSFVVAAVAAGEGPASIEVSDSLSLPAVLPLGAQGDLHTVTGVLREVVYDPARNRAYATNETYGRLEILDVAQGGFLPPLALGAAPWGLDLSPDRSRLLVCLSGAAQIAVVDLTVDPPAVSATIPVPVDAAGASNPRWIACASNNRAFFSCADAGAGYTILRQLDLGTMAVTPRTDVNGGQTLDPTYLAASADRARIVFVHGIAGGAFYHYTAATDAFAGPRNLPVTNPVRGVTVNGDGSLFAFAPDGYLAGPDLYLRGSIWLGGGAVVLAPAGNRGYFTIGGTIYRALYPDFLRQLDSIPTPASGITGMMKSDAEGRTLYALANGGLLRVPVDVNRPPVFVAGGGFSVNVGETAGTTFEAIDLDGDPVHYCAANLPANAAFDPATRRLTFAPSLAQAGSSFTNVEIYASDGRNARLFTATLSATNPPSYPSRQFSIGGSVLSNLGELAYDALRNRLYVVSGSGDRIDVVDVATNAVLDPIRVGTSPVGIDITPDASKLVVCPSGTEFIKVVDLTATPPTVTAIPVPDGPTPDSRRPWTVGIAANGRAFFTTWGPSNGSPIHIRDLNLATGSVTVRNDVPGGTATSTTLVRSSRDHSRLVFAQSQVTPRVMFTYDSAANAFGPTVNRANFIGDVDVNGDGSRVLVAPGAELYDQGLSSLGTFPAAVDWRVAFRQGGTTTGYRFALVSSTVEILNLATLTSGGTFTGGPSLYGRMVTNDAGTRLFIVLQNGLSIITLP